MIRCDTCPRCKDIYPDKVDWAGNHFCICGMSGNKVYTKPRKEPRYSGHGYIHYGVGSCGLYDSVGDALKHMTHSEIERLRKEEPHK